MLNPITRLFYDLYSIRYRKVFLMDGLNVVNVIPFKLDEKMAYEDMVFMEPKQDEKYNYGLNEIVFYDISTIKPLKITTAETRKKIVEDMLKEKSEIEKLIFKTVDAIPLNTANKKYIEKKLKQKIVPVQVEPATLFINKISPKEYKITLESNAFTKISKPPSNISSLFSGKMPLYILVGLIAFGLILWVLTGHKLW